MPDSRSPGLWQTERREKGISTYSCPISVLIPFFSSYPLFFVLGNLVARQGFQDAGTDGRVFKTDVPLAVHAHSILLDTDEAPRISRPESALAIYQLLFAVRRQPDEP